MLTTTTPFFALLVAALIAAGIPSAAGDGWWVNANRARNATGGPVKPATTRDYVLVTLYAVIALTAVVVGLWFMKK